MHISPAYNKTIIAVIPSSGHLDNLSETYFQDTFTWSTRRWQIISLMRVLKAEINFSKGRTHLKYDLTGDSQTGATSWTEGGKRRSYLAAAARPWAETGPRSWLVALEGRKVGLWSRVSSAELGPVRVYSVQSSSALHCLGITETRWGPMYVEFVQILFQFVLNITINICLFHYLRWSMDERLY